MDGIHPESLDSLDTIYRLNALKEMKKDFDLASNEFEDKKFDKIKKSK